MKKAGVSRGQSGAVVALQRTSSDLHVLFLDGVYQEEGENVVFHALPHLSTREVGSVLERVVRRIERFLKKRGLVRAGENDACDDADPDAELTLEQGHAALCASAASGKSPPAGPEVRRKTTPLVPLARKALSFDKPLCASLDDFTLHAATRVGGLDTRARESLIKNVLRPPIAQERVTAGPDGLVRIALKRPFADGTVAIDLDPLSLLSRLATSVPAKRTHTVRCAGVLGSASKLRSRIVPVAPVAPAAAYNDHECKPKPSRCRYRTWAELLGTLGIDGLTCPKCAGRMRVLDLVREAHDIKRTLKAMGEPTEVPARAPARGPPYERKRERSTRQEDRRFMVVAAPSKICASSRTPKSAANRGAGLPPADTRSRVVRAPLPLAAIVRVRRRQFSNGASERATGLEEQGAIGEEMATFLCGIPLAVCAPHPASSFLSARIPRNSS